MSVWIKCSQEIGDLLTQTDDLLFFVPTAAEYDASIHQHIVKEEEGFRLWTPAALLHQPTLSDQNPAWLEQGLP